MANLISKKVKSDDKEQKKDKITLKEMLSLYLRYFTEAAKAYPQIISIVIPSKVIKSLSPFVNIWFSAQIITELSGERRAELLWKKVILALVSAVLLLILNGILEHAKNVVDSQFMNYKTSLLHRKMLSMDYQDIYKNETHDLYAQIDQSEMWGGWGVLNLYQNYQSLLEEIFAILGSLFLTMGLFKSKVPESAGRWIILNHPVFVFLLFFLIFFIIYGSSALVTKALANVSKLDEDTTLGNRIFNYFGFLTAADSIRALDFRVYNQQIICRKETESVNGMHYKKLANLAKGSLGRMDALSYAVNGILTFLIYTFVCLKAWAGAFGVGNMTQYISALAIFIVNLNLILKDISLLKINAPYMRIIYQYLDIPNTMYHGSLTTEKRNDRKYEVEFKDVSFKYPGTEKYVLRHINLKFKVGNRLAIVGENGSGKSTFIKLMCRLYDPDEGQILLNGIDIRKYNYKEYMDIFSIVFQDFQLISQSVGSNVAGADTFDEVRVRKALEDAGFKECLENLKQGVNTLLFKELSSEGIEISGGEAQKIAIARALYKDAPFIILDEPTAALDPVTEAEIYSKFNDIVGDKTAIYISHRLSSCKFCDEIVVFANGSIIQHGTHEQLVAEKDGKYYELWQAQAKYYQ